MFEGCVTVIYMAMVFGFSLFGLNVHQFESVFDLMLAIILSTYLITVLIMIFPDTC